MVLILNKEAISQSADTIIIRNFNTGNYQATSFNYMGIHARDGNYYFANENGILQYDGSEWLLHNIKNYAGVLSLAETENGILYIGGFNEFGRARKDSTGTFEYTSMRDLLHADSTLSEVWQTIYHKGSAYFQSYERILRWDGDSLHNIPLKNCFLFVAKNKLYASQLHGNFYEITGDSLVFISDKLKFEQDGAMQVLPWSKDKLIIFTSSHGLFLFDDQTNSIEKFDAPVSDFFKKAYMYYGVLWKDSLYICSTWEKGLAFVNKKGEMVKNLTKSDGLSTNFLREPLLDKRGNLWVASNYGITYLQWPKLNEPDTPPATQITKISRGENDLISPYFKENVTVPFESSVTFHYATYGFDKADMKYSYYLEGYSNNWSAWNDDVKKEYTNLSSGDYVFHVKGKLINGMETMPASLSITIPKPWYLSYGFIGLMALLSVAVIYGVIKLRTLQLKRLNKQLESVVNARTAELLAQREQLQNANKDLMTINSELDNFVYRSSHDLVAPLKSLKGLIHLAKIDNPGDTQMHYLQIMNNSVLRLEDFIKSIMDYSVNAKREIILQEVKLDDVINDIVTEIKYFEKAEKVDLKKKYGADFTLKSDSSRLKIILSNLITNSVKYHNYEQPRPYVKVIAHQDDQKTEIAIQDNGQGIPEAYLEKIFDMFFRASESAEGSGLGLYIVKDTADKLGAEIRVESEEGVGTTFTLTIPNHR
ncbi:two-component sensor histidine kinase [Fulvivirga imtechensis AK7]|uniref:histidine kinase n=1 Tax=Fulvivirga imtechensis AK7 TaxID=1237149 RepID=L8JXX4_9BACT|nr:ATP-binding protein [Fulvivirga imtechensis]ELR73911.1 two-component sensor histidine kinase [Fulvivirga imtechensis AK7]